MAVYYLFLTLDKHKLFILNEKCFKSYFNSLIPGLTADKQATYRCRGESRD